MVLSKYKKFTKERKWTQISNHLHLNLPQQGQFPSRKAPSRSLKRCNQINLIARRYQMRQLSPLLHRVTSTPAAHQPTGHQQTVSAEMSGGSSKFSSNPLTATGKGLGKLFTVNPLSSFTILFLPLLLIFGFLGLLVPIVIASTISPILSLLVGLLG